MSKLAATFGVLALLATGAVFATWSMSSKTTDIITSPETIDLAAGKVLYAEACASCHGANLEGQENWRTPDSDGRLPAPPHDESGHTWHHGDQALFAYTKLGGTALMAERGMDFDSGMPGFSDQLSDQDIWNILGYIKSTWSVRVQKIQAERTENE